MKKQLIRQSVFETNSSSAHSISLGRDTGKQFLLDTLYPDQHGVITIEGDEFGWDWFKSNDAYTKAQYAAVASMNNADFRNTLEQVIKDQTGCETVIFYCSPAYDHPNYSYIDHDSEGICPADYDGLKDFIFNKNSWLFGGNDNSEPHPEFYHVPEYKDGREIKPEYKWELKIERFGKGTRFLTYPTNDEIYDALESLLRGVYFKNGYFDDDNSIYAQINRNRNEYYEFQPYKCPPDIDNGIIFLIKGSAPSYDTNISYDERMELMREHFKKTAHQIKFQINEISKR